MEKIVISEAIKAKLASAHDVSVTEVHQCFANRTGKLLADLREEHATDPPTRWFIAPTNKGRLLKVCYVPREDYFVRTCYEPKATLNKPAKSTARADELRPIGFKSKKSRNLGHVIN